MESPPDGGRARGPLPSDVPAGGRELYGLVSPEGRHFYDTRKGEQHEKWHMELLPSDRQTGARNLIQGGYVHWTHDGGSLDVRVLHDHPAALGHAHELVSSLAKPRDPVFIHFYEPGKTGLHVEGGSRRTALKALAVRRVGLEEARATGSSAEFVAALRKNRVTLAEPSSTGLTDFKLLPKPKATPSPSSAELDRLLGQGSPYARDAGPAAAYQRQRALLGGGGGKQTRMPTYRGLPDDAEVYGMVAPDGRHWHGQRIGDDEGIHKWHIALLPPAERDKYQTSFRAMHDGFVRYEATKGYVGVATTLKGPHAARSLEHAKRLVKRFGRDGDMIHMKLIGDERTGHGDDVIYVTDKVAEAHEHLDRHAKWARASLEEAQKPSGKETPLPTREDVPGDAELYGMISPGGNHYHSKRTSDHEGPHKFHLALLPKKERDKYQGGWDAVSEGSYLRYQATQGFISLHADINSPHASHALFHAQNLVKRLAHDGDTIYLRLDGLHGDDRLKWIKKPSEAHDYLEKHRKDAASSEAAMARWYRGEKIDEGRSYRSFHAGGSNEYLGPDELYRKSNDYLGPDELYRKYRHNLMDTGRITPLPKRQDLSDEHEVYGMVAPDGRHWHGQRIGDDEGIHKWHIALLPQAERDEYETSVDAVHRGYLRYAATTGFLGLDANLNSRHAGHAIGHAKRVLSHLAQDGDMIQINLGSWYSNLPETTRTSITTRSVAEAHAHLDTFAEKHAQHLRSGGAVEEARKVKRPPSIDTLLRVAKNLEGPEELYQRYRDTIHPAQETKIPTRAQLPADEEVYGMVAPDGRHWHGQRVGDYEGVHKFHVALLPEAERDLYQSSQKALEHGFLRYDASKGWLSVHASLASPKSVHALHHGQALIKRLARPGDAIHVHLEGMRMHEFDQPTDAHRYLERYLKLADRAGVLSDPAKRPMAREKLSEAAARTDPVPNDVVPAVRIAGRVFQGLAHEGHFELVRRLEQAKPGGFELGFWHIGKKQFQRRRDEIGAK